MLPPTDCAAAVLSALIGAPVGWRTPEELASDSGLDLSTISEALVDLDIAGWIHPWELAGKTLATLSPAGAERLRVRLIQVGRSDSMRWASIDDPEPPPPRPSGRCSFIHPEALARLLDPTPGAEAVAIIAESLAKLARRKPAEVDPAAAAAAREQRLAMVPRPTRLLGQGLTPWPGPAIAASGLCPGCSAHSLAANEYCLVCDRWGLDGLLATLLVRDPRSTQSARRNPSTRSQDKALAQSAKAARRAKHRRRLKVEAGDPDRGKSGKGRKPPGSSNPQRWPSSSARPATRSASR